jgi:hypothetical protein
MEKLEIFKNINIQEYYNDVCLRYNKLRLKVFFVENSDWAGLYIEVPFSKIYLNIKCNDRVVFHEIFHHIRLDLMDGIEFELLLDDFIWFENIYLKYNKKI